MAAATTDTGRNASELCTALQRELSLGRKLREAADALTSAIKERHGGRISEIENQIGGLRGRLDEVEKQRVAAAMALASGMGLLSEGGEIPAIREIARHVAPVEANRLLSLRSAILATDALVRDANNRNRKLLESGLAYVRFSINTLTGLALQQPRYGANPVAAARPSFYIDQRA